MIFGEFRRWLNNLSPNPRGRAAGRKRARPARLGLEVLEDRAVPAAGFFQGWELDTAGWNAGAGRVASGTNGVISRTGNFHGQIAQGSSAFTWFGSSSAAGYTATFPQGGFTNSVDFYLDATGLAAGATANDTRFDYTVAIGTPALGHRRDFVFNAGYYNDAGQGPRFVISASNNTGRANSFPKNPDKSPFTITASGWYTFQHRFVDSGNGVLAVQLSIKDSSGATLNTWTLSNATDIIGSTVGGNRYGWVATQELPALAIENSFQSNPSTVYVDDDWASLPAGTDSDGSGPANLLGFDSFSKIQDAVNSVAAGGTVNVAGGIYNESVNLNKAVTLAGNATITGTLTASAIGAVLNPGVDGAGIISSGNLTLPVGSSYDADLSGAGHDQLNVTGSVNLGGALNVALGSASAVGDEFVIINNDGSDAVNGAFASLPEGTILTIDGRRFQVSYVGGDGNDVTLTHINTPPVLTDVQLTPRILEDGAAVLTGTVNDPDSADSFAVRVVWGDGSSSVVTVAAGQTTFQLTHKYTQEGNFQVDVTVTDGTGDVDVAVRGVEVVNKVTATVAYPNGRPLVQVRDAETHKVLRSFFPFSSALKGEVRLAVGDVNGDIIPDVVVVPATGHGGFVKVFNSQTGAEQLAFRAFPNHKSGSFNVKLNRNDDIVVTMRAGNRVVRRVFDGNDGHRLSSTSRRA